MAVNELTPLSSLRLTDAIVIQTPGEQGDVMLATIGDLISEIFDPIFARLQSPEFTGEPTVPSIADLNANDLRAANTEFVQAIAEKKADVKDPAIEGQASFVDSLPTASDEDGEIVVLATRKDIAAVNQSISDLSESINNLTAALDSLRSVKSVAIPAYTNRITVTEPETMATKSAGIVTCCVRFSVNSALNAETQILQLPVGYRPGRTYRLTVHSWNGTDHYTVSVYTNGAITMHNSVAAGKSFIFNFAFPVPDTEDEEE